MSTLLGITNLHTLRAHAIGSLATARQAIGDITEFSIPIAKSQPVGIASGPDGNLWFTEISASNIGRITPTGSITEFPLKVDSAPGAITSGPDGNLWFTEGVGLIGRISPSGSVTEFSI